MPPTPPVEQLHAFRTAKAFETWMRRHHATASEIWLRIYKKDSGVPTITVAEALDIALCWGWIDGIRKALDEMSYVQRYTPRRPRSLWSQVNQAHVARLIAAGRMTPYGQAEIDKAKADGRWSAAYPPMRSASETMIPDDLRTAITASPRALATYRALSKQNFFLIAFKVNAMKTAAGRARKIAELVAMLERGETIAPQK